MRGTWMPMPGTGGRLTATDTLVGLGATLEAGLSGAGD